MNLFKYRQTSDYREILRLFQKSSEQGVDSFLWQNIAGKRVLHPVSHLEIDFVGREVVVYLDRPLELNASSVIYCKLSCNDTIFKVQDFFIQQDCLSFKFPQTLQTWELRSSERYSLDESEEYSAVLSVNSLAEASQQFKVRLNDFSATGLGLSISEFNKHIIKSNKTFWVHAINDYQLPRPIEAEVMYLSKDTQGKKYRFGIKLGKVLPIEAIRSVIS